MENFKVLTGLVNKLIAALIIVRQTVIYLGISIIYKDCNKLW